MFNGDRLRIARQRRVMTKQRLAAAISVSPRAVTGWEAGEYPPEQEKISVISSVLGFPESFFFLDDSAKTPTGAVSFRSLSTKTAGKRDAALAMCDIARDVASWIEERFSLPRPVVPDLRDESPSIAATLLRQEWGLGIKPVGNMIWLLEAKGIRIFSLAENCREIDACSFWSNDTPFILLNTEVSTERMRFDMVHELAHLVLHRHGAPIGRAVETEAHRFASEFLMPEESVRANRPRVWSINSLLEKKKIWNVSISALAYRVHQLGYTTEWHNKSLNIEMRRRGHKDIEPNSLPREQSKVLETVLGRLREIGIPLRFAANQIGIPEDELRGLFWGLAKVAVEGMASPSDGASYGHLRIMK